ncbi:unnamed protein product [Boreogadus saida]
MRRSTYPHETILFSTFSPSLCCSSEPGLNRPQPANNRLKRFHTSIPGQEAKMTAQSQLIGHSRQRVHRSGGANGEKSRAGRHASQQGPCVDEPGPLSGRSKGTWLTHALEKCLKALSSTSARVTPPEGKHKAPEHHRSVVSHHFLPLLTF